MQLRIKKHHFFVPNLKLSVLPEENLEVER